MARFPIQRARQELGFTPHITTRAATDTRTGEEDIGRAVAGLGEAVLGLGLKYDLKQANTQFSEYKRKVGEDNVRRDIEIKNELDPDKHEAIFKEHAAFQRSFMPTNRRAIQVATIWNNQQAPIQLQALTDARQFQTKDNERTEIFNSQQEVLRSPATLGAFEKQLARVMFIDKNNPDGTSPTFSKLEAAKILADTRKMAEIGTITNLYGAGEFAEARIQANAAKLLTPRERESILNTIDAEERNLQTQVKLAIKQKDDAISEGFLSLLANKLDPTKQQLTFDIIRLSELSFGAKKEWFATLRTFDNYSEGELKEAFTDKGEVLADIYDKIDDGTLTDELDTMVGRGLSPTTAQRIKKEIREPFKKDTEQLFKRIFGWSPELGFENELSSFLYEKTLRTWEAEVKEQDAKGEKIIEIGRSIARPYFLEHLRKTMPSEINISRMMELALGEEIKEVKPAEPIETKEEKTIEELYKVGETRTDTEGQLWEYIGDNKWRKK